MRNETQTLQLVEITVRVDVPLTRGQAMELLGHRVGRFDGDLDLSTRDKVRKALTGAVRDEFRVWLNEGPPIYMEPYWKDRAKAGIKRLLTYPERKRKKTK